MSIFHVTDLNKKLEARLKEAKRKSFVCSEAPIERTHSAPCEVSWNRTRSVGSSISHPTSGQLASSHYQMAHAQWNEPLVSRSASHAPVTLGDVLKARGSGNYTRGEFRCLANGLEEEKNGGTLKDGRRTGERMYSKWVYLIFVFVQLALSGQDYDRRWWRHLTPMPVCSDVRHYFVKSVVQSWT